LAHTDQELMACRDALVTRSAAQLAELTARHVDLNEQRKVDLQFSAPNEAAARTLAAAMVRNEMATPVIVAPDNESVERWRVCVAMSASAEFIASRDNLVTFILFADEYDCDFDAWILETAH
jgi:hypothetical protein